MSEELHYILAESRRPNYNTGKAEKFNCLSSVGKGVLDNPFIVKIESYINGVSGEQDPIIRDSNNNLNWLHLSTIRGKPWGTSVKFKVISNTMEKSNIKVSDIISLDDIENDFKE